MRLSVRGARTIATVCVIAARDSQWLGETVCSAGQAAVLFVPAEGAGFRVTVQGKGDPLTLTLSPAERGGGDGWCPSLLVTALSPASAVVPALLRHPLKTARSVVRAALRGHRDIVRHLRPELAHLAQTPCNPGPYSLWTELFDQWPEPELRRLCSGNRADWPTVDCCVFQAGPSPAPLRATLDALKTSPFRAGLRVIAPGVRFADALAASRADYVALIQSGEVLSRHALPLLADQAAALGWPDIIYADEDCLTPRGRRHSPVFRPEPSRMLMLSGTLATGVWLVRRHLLAHVPAHGANWAEAVRLDAWLRLQESGRSAAGTRRLPFVLTHRRPDTEKAPPEALARVARDHVARTDLPARVEAATPLRIRVAAPREQQAKVSIIIPSGCHLPHVLRCITGLLTRTDYADFEVIIVVAGPLPPDPRQRATLARLRADPRVRTLILATPTFNYARVNNEAARHSDAPYLCLLNDDVTPLARDWLATMVGHLADPDIGVVGARLLYPDRSVQHAGIILRPDGTGEHVHRLLSHRSRGYAHRAVLSQEVSAVTGACLLTRRSLYGRLGGLDESFASAFNDVDFCLRARAAGQGVVLAAEAELIHHESLSYGRHYTPAEAARAAADRARMLARWGAWCAEDPFHNPNLSRHAGGLWHPAFPPRVTQTASAHARDRAA
ncbi:MAG: glycosyltransferase [Acetobacteraceae bacterium]